jgi:hypothetical protein
VPIYHSQNIVQLAIVSWQKNLTMFREYLFETNLDIVFLPGVVMCCCMIENLMLNGKDEEIDIFI